MAEQTFVDCGVVDLLCGRVSEVTGLEDESDGALRVFIGPRYNGIYAVIEADAEEVQRTLREAWDCGGHVLIPTPPSNRLMRLVSA